MNTQSTPVHIHLWHREFWLMALANLLVTMAVYILVPVMPDWLLQSQNLSYQETGLAMGAFGAGLFLLGCFTCFLVEHYRRNVACVWAILLMAGSLAFLFYLNSQQAVFAGFPLILLQRLSLGAAFGVAQMILASTLIIDTCESFQRTEANHSASWFSRFALSLGPMAGIIVERMAGFGTVLLAAIGCALTAVVLILMVHFPFRAPREDMPLVSLDRFFLTQGWPLFVNLMLITMVVGLLMSTGLSELFYAMMMSGFLLALLAQRFVFRDADLKSEVVTGLVLTGTALLMILMRQQAIVDYAAPLFVGFGVGIIGSRFLLFFIKLSRHCQRGTSQSTFMLGWESGIALGLGVGYGLLEAQVDRVLQLSLIVTVLALLLYNFKTHNWFLHHKNR
ncbi:MAG: MFS transporter [Prevotella sp.]|nr:MFS transporter [Prevotella sp.]